VTCLPRACGQYGRRQGAAFGPDSPVLAGIVTAIAEDTRVWARGFMAE